MSFLGLPSGRADRALVGTKHWEEAWRRTGKWPAAAMVWTPEQAGAFLDLAATDEAVRPGSRSAETSSPATRGPTRAPARQPRRRHRRGPARSPARQAGHRLLLRSTWVDTGLVFTKADGAALVPDSASQRFDRLVVRAGLPPVRLRDLRHLAVSLTYRATKDLKPTSQMPGHSSTASPSRSTRRCSRK